MESASRTRLCWGSTLLPKLVPGQELVSLGSPSAAASAPATGVGCSLGAASAWGAESRKPGTGLPTQTTQRRGGNSFIALSCSRPPPPLSAEVSFSSGRQQQGSGRGRGAWRYRSAQSATRGRPLPDRDGGARTVREWAYACVSRRRMRVPLSQATATKPGLLPSLDLTRPPLPSDSAAQKANGEGASFTVHINLVFVGYALAAANAFRKRVNPTAGLEPLHATSCSAYTGSGSAKGRVVKRCVGLRVCHENEVAVCY